jgi:TonB family protein
MNEFTLANFAAWSVQAGVLALAAAVLSHVLRIDAPAVRYAWWRTVLLICLALPLIQPWQPPGLPPVAILDVEATAPIVEMSAPASAGARATAATPAVSISWPIVAMSIIGGGAMLRLGWLVLGLAHLRRLRSAGIRAEASGAPESLQLVEDAGAEVRYVPSLRQPVTFGIRRPVVLLPETLPSMPPAIQRAVIVHELWHVRRRDWTWTLAEEALRSVLWFHPAIWYLVSRVQSAREEVVDELSVLSTNARRSYLEALLAFADEPAVHPAAPFAKRRQLFNRMLLISREAMMSPRRIVCSAAGMAGALVMTGWYASLAFPLTASSLSAPAAPITPPSLLGRPDTTPAAMLPRRSRSGTLAATSQQAQTQPRDPRPGVPRVVSAREQQLQGALRTDPTSVANWLELAKLQEERDAIADAETTLQAALGATQSRQVLMSMAGFYNRQGQFDKTMAALEDAAARDTSDPAGHQLVAVYYWEKAQKDQRLTPEQKATYIQSGIAASDRALALNPDYIEALTYKNILLRMQGNMETDLARRQALYAQADGLRNRAVELAKARGPVPSAQGGFGTPPPPPPPPPMPPFVDGVQAIRIGGAIKTPTKIRDVKPVYPPEALAADVSGVVIVEALIDPQGNVHNTQVLRSIPMLDQAALDAIKQWQFTPTLLNGVAVPVVMTLTVNFTKQ